MRRSSLLFGLDNCPTESFAAFLRDVKVPGDDLLSIDASLQARFFQKNPDGSPKERWELDKVEIDCPIKQIKEHLGTCGFMNKTQPSGKIYGYAAWPGALVTRAVVRLNDLVNAWDDGVRWEQTIVFGGKRPLQSDKESFTQCCNSLGLGNDRHHEFVPIWDGFWPVNELEMMRFIWAAIAMPNELRAIPVIFVDAPMKQSAKEGSPLVRPTTEDTAKEWLEGKPNPGSILLSSGAPYGMAMDEAFWMLLEPHGFTVETFGHAAPDLPTENLMREVAGTVNRIHRAHKA